MAVIAPGLCPEGKPCSHFTDALALSQSQESLEALDQLERTAGVGLLETAREWRASEGTAL